MCGYWGGGICREKGRGGCKRSELQWEGSDSHVLTLITLNLDNARMKCKKKCEIYTLYSSTYSFIPLFPLERYVVMILCGYSLVRCYNGRKCVNMFTRPPPIRVARAHKVPMFNVWINLDHFQAHPTPPVSKKGNNHPCGAQKQHKRAPLYHETIVVEKT